MKKVLCLLGGLAYVLAFTGCAKIEARMEIKQANQLYLSEKYAEALPHYENARNIDGSFEELDRLIGYSYIGLYQPGNDAPENEKYADKAIHELKQYLTKEPDDTTAREALVNLYLNAERTDQAIGYFRDYLKANPADLNAVKSIATLYAKKGDFNESLNWYKKITLLDARNPEAFYIYGVVCYEKVAKNPPEDIQERVEILNKGKEALARATQLREKYFEALVYMNLLYREHAKLVEDPVEQQDLLAKADEYRNEAVAIARERKAASEKPSTES